MNCPRRKKEATQKKKGKRNVKLNYGHILNSIHLSQCQHCGCGERVREGKLSSNNGKGREMKISSFLPFLSAPCISYPFLHFHHHTLERWPKFTDNGERIRWDIYVGIKYNKYKMMKVPFSGVDGKYSYNDCSLSHSVSFLTFLYLTSSPSPSPSLHLFIHRLIYYDSRGMFTMWCDGRKRDFFISLFFILFSF